MKLRTKTIKKKDLAILYGDPKNDEETLYMIKESNILDFQNNYIIIKTPYRNFYIEDNKIYTTDRVKYGLMIAHNKLHHLILTDDKDKRTLNDINSNFNYIILILAITIIKINIIDKNGNFTIDSTNLYNKTKEFRIEYIIDELYANKIIKIISDKINMIYTFEDYNPIFIKIINNEYYIKQFCNNTSFKDLIMFR